MAEKPVPRVPIYAVERLTKTIQGHEILKDLSFSIYADAKVGIVGENGSGKSTLLRILAREDTDHDGVVRPFSGVTFGYLPQEPRLDPSKNVLGNVEEGAKAVRDLLTEFDRLSNRLAEDLTPDEMQAVLDKQSAVQEQIERKEGWELDHHIELAMEALSCPPPDADVSKLSGGERRRVALCRLLMQHPDLLLLDEPTNHLDAATTEWLEHFLTNYHGAWLLVTHDRWFLEHSTNQMVELDRGRIFVFEGSYSAFLDAKRRRLEQEQAQESARQRILARELEWIRATPSARTVRNKARVARFHDLEAQELDARKGTVELRLPTGPRLGDKVISLRGVRKAYGDQVLFDQLDLELPPGGIVGVVGPNGAGKTTLLRVMTGQERPDAGTVEIGQNTVFCYVDQNRETLHDDRTVFEEVAEGGETIKVGKEEIHVRGYLSRFLFRGPDQSKLVGQLSGGERNRLQLAKLLKKGGNVLILDEPTNDLDLETLRVLEEALVAFPGCAIVVTHDRYFLDRVATHIVAFEGDGKVTYTEGTYEYYREKKAERDAAAGVEAASKKGKYKKLARPGA
ncbi:MAG: energy-dependent translational throttle protein EttA [Planctomycetes bacterium]|nr:energy-dependent translational throttle protein EttA [Planctomycetota bacterium]